MKHTTTNRRFAAFRNFMRETYGERAEQTTDGAIIIGQDWIRFHDLPSALDYFAGAIAEHRAYARLLLPARNPNQHTP